MLDTADETQHTVGKNSGDVDRQRLASRERSSAQGVTSDAPPVVKKQRVAIAKRDSGRPTRKKSARKPEQEKSEGEVDDEKTPVQRNELLEKALRVVADDLSLDRSERPANTIGSLVQLLKLDRAFREDEEQPHEIHVVWEEKRDETIDDSAENSNDD